jgi:flavin reductase (DIM6/NTAB) family NADH-FMN oxidoreductase RutF
MNDTRDFRNALGQFATGVTIITTRDNQGAPVGVTVNSFNSVSLEPKLVLWSLAKKSYSLDAFSNAEHFIIHVLAADQKELSNRFAKGSAEKFNDVAYSDGLGGAPLLAGCAASFECRNIERIDGGDHYIFLGQVERFQVEERPVLLFYKGSYTGAHADKPLFERFGMTEMLGSAA